MIWVRRHTPKLQFGSIWMRLHDKPWDIHWILGTYFGKRPIEIPLPEDFLYHLHQRGPRRNGSDHCLPVVGCVVFDVGMGGISGELNQKSREIVRW